MFILNGLYIDRLMKKSLLPHKAFNVLWVVIALMPTAFAQKLSLPVLHLTYDAKALNHITYIDGSVLVTDTAGATTELNAIFKIRGATALQYPMKPSLNMKLRDEAGEELDYNLLGLREASSFILDAMAIDRINMRNRVCFDIWNSFSRLPYDTKFGSRNGTVGKFVEVYINGGYKGIYCLTDKINRKLLGLKKPKTNDDGTLNEVRGVLYKQGTNDIEKQENVGPYNDWSVYVAEWHDAWELHEPDNYPCPEVWEPLLDLYRNGNNANYAYVKNHFYLQNLADYTIHLMALCINDNWGNKNKYFSIVNIQDETRFVVTPWDLDSSLGGDYNGSKFDGDYYEWTIEQIVNSAPLPFSMALTKTEFRTMLKETWAANRRGAFDVDSVSQRLDDYCNLFVQGGAWQRTCDLWKNKNEKEAYVEDLTAEIVRIKEWYRKRYGEMDEYFGTSDNDGIDDGIDEITVDTGIEADRICNLQGVRVSNMTSPGVYIIPGKKVIMR